MATKSTACKVTFGCRQFSRTNDASQVASDAEIRINPQMKNEFYENPQYMTYIFERKNYLICLHHS
jgi:hypothetical protein